MSSGTESNAAAGRGTGLDGFNVAKYDGGTSSGTLTLLTGFGTTLTVGHGQPGVQSQLDDAGL